MLLSEVLMCSDHQVLTPNLNSICKLLHQNCAHKSILHVTHTHSKTSTQAAVTIVKSSPSSRLFWLSISPWESSFALDFNIWCISLKHAVPGMPYSTAALALPACQDVKLLADWLG